jgi:hypothetical protein
MPQGICKLCLTDADLQWSHYLPKALYRLQRPDGDNPYFTSSQLIIQDQKQIADYLLCSICEQRFDKFGEKHVLKMVHRNEEGFKLLEIIRANPWRRRSEGDYTVYRAADIGVDTAPLAYFALSVVWRGIHIWPTFNGSATGGLQVGVHEEPLRCYLLTRGLWFDVVMGDPLPEYVYDNCCVGSRQELIFVGDFDKYVMWELRSNKQTAKLSKKLEARRISDLRRTP